MPSAWNLPEPLHKLTPLTAAASLLFLAAARLLAACGAPLLVLLPLLHAALVAAVVAAAAATRRSAHAWRRLFGKDESTGRIPLAARILMAPYYLGIRGAIGLYKATSREAAYSKVAPHLWLGALPTRPEALPAPDCALLDVSNELRRPAGGGGWQGGGVGQQCGGC